MIDNIVYFPPYLLLIIKKGIVFKDFKVWKDTIEIPGRSDFRRFVWLFKNLKEYRTVFYWRIGRLGRIMSFFYKAHPCLYIQVSPQKVGEGLVIQHGHSTVILIESCGKNCQIWQNVTLGKKYSGVDQKKPRIGDNVKICAGAIVLGDISVGNNVTIGAATLVLKNVPDNCTVVGNPARIIRRNGVAVNEPL